MSLEQFRRPVVVASEEESSASAARKMRDASVGCVIVVRGGRPVGIVTDRDLALRVLAEGRDAERTRVADVVTYDPYVVRVSDNIATATARIRKHGVRRLPLVDAEGNVAGIVTADELVVFLGQKLAELCEGIDDSADAGDSR